MVGRLGMYTVDEASVLELVEMLRGGGAMVDDMRREELHVVAPQWGVSTFADVEQFADCDALVERGVAAWFEVVEDVVVLVLVGADLPEAALRLWSEREAARVAAFLAEGGVS
jgi:hypothetical protein